MSQIQVYNVSAGGGGPILTLTGNTGGAVGPTAGNINVVGGPGVTVTGTPGTSTLTITVSGEFVWVDAIASQVMVVNTGYISDSVALITLTLPAVSAFGDRVRVGGKGAGKWIITQGAGQQIHAVGTDTTIGATGSLAATNMHDAVELICTTANLEWLALSTQGNLTYT